MMHLTMHAAHTKPRRFAPALAAAVLLAATASPTLAARPEEEHEIVDARLEGYGNNVNVTLPPSSSGSTWVIFIILGLALMAAWIGESERRVRFGSVHSASRLLPVIVAAALLSSACGRQVEKEAAAMTGGDVKRGRTAIAKYG